MYNSSFLDTVAGTRLVENIGEIKNILQLWDKSAVFRFVGDIGKIKEHLQRNEDREQSAFRFGTVEDMASFIEMMVAQGWRYIGHIDMSKKAAYDIRTGADKNPDRYLLIMGK